MPLIDKLWSPRGLGALFSTLIFVIAATGGEVFDGARNANCYAWLGCDSGFFGYDAVEHLLFGFAAAWIIAWLCEALPRYSILSIEWWRSALAIISLVALIAVGWEICEFLWDAYSLDVLHKTLVNLQLHINRLEQPSNFDTMGDLVAGLVGALIALPFLKLRHSST